MVDEIREAPRQCACPNGENNCVCPSPEILEPVNLPVNSGKTRRSPQMTTTAVCFKFISFKMINSYLEDHFLAVSELPLPPATATMQMYYSTK